MKGTGGASHNSVLVNLVVASCFIISPIESVIEKSLRELHKSSGQTDNSNYRYTDNINKAAVRGQCLTG